jgi:hypothetical protein
MEKPPLLCGTREAVRIITICSASGPMAQMPVGGARGKSYPLVNWYSGAAKKEDWYVFTHHDRH